MNTGMQRPKFNFTRFDDFVTPKPGIHYDIPFSDYMKWNAFSKSMVGPALKSAAHLKKYIIDGKKTKSLKFGTLVDCLVLEPHLFESTFAIQPETYEKITMKGPKGNKQILTEQKPWNLNSNTCKEIKADLEASGKTIASVNEIDMARLCEQALFENEEFHNAKRSGKKQVSIVWIDKESGILCKGRIDLWNDGVLWDLKTTIDASPEGFSYQLKKFGYHVQAGAYSDGMEQLTGDLMPFRFACVETSEETEKPAVALYEIDDESRQAGLLKFKRACRKVAGYSDENITGYSPFIEPIGINTWEINREFELAEQAIDEGEF